MEFICAGNWKMNKGPADAAAYLKSLKEMAQGDELSHVVLFPPAYCAPAVAEGTKGTAIRWGSQNSFPAPNGAATGENSPTAFKDMGAMVGLVGHSERRHIFGEPDEAIAKKVQFLQSVGVTPLLCVGETMDDRRWSRTSEVILRQIRIGLTAADPNLPLWIAYEPVWAIGTGEVATPLQVEEVHSILRNYLLEWSAAASATTPILYGGSVKSDNVQSLASLSHVSGFLIGGASLDPKEFLSILRLAREARGNR